VKPPAVLLGLFGRYGITDDVTIEKRYPKHPWASDAGTRAIQRKCMLAAEYIRAHPEEAARIDAARRVTDALQVQQPMAPARKPSTPSSRRAAHEEAPQEFVSMFDPDDPAYR
jgi:hypothetical protein